MILNGKEIALKIQNQLKERLLTIPGRMPGLAVILVGNHPPSLIYVQRKQEACKKVGIHSELIQLDENVDQSQLIKHIQNLNQNPLIDGILLQLPLPDHLNCAQIIEYIDPKKDVDCFHPYNMGRLALGSPTFIPCTPGGIQLLLQETNVSTRSKHAVILGRSNLVGKPMSLLLSQKGAFADATVTMIHSQSKHIKEICKEADLLIAAIGSPHFVGEDFIKEGAIVIDVGINRVDGKIIGDVAFDLVKNKCSLITPVPGGVGPMTITMLLQNTIKSFSN